MGKRQPAHPLEDNPFADDFVDWMGSDEGQLSVEALDVVWYLLKTAAVDAHKRKIIWEDGKRLSIPASVRRIHAEHPEFPADLIEVHLIGWLQMDYVPPDYSEEQLAELDRLTDQWVDDHERKAQASQKRPRTPHS
jgi:ABC-type Fe3+ transport system substrate-binding protein